MSPASARLRQTQNCTPKHSQEVVDEAIDMFLLRYRVGS